MRFIGKNSENQPTETVEIAPQSTGTVPAKIWKRYAKRKDIIGMDGTKIVIGGCTPEELAQKIKTPEGQRSALEAERKSLTADRAKLEEDRATMEATIRAELEAELKKAAGEGAG